MGAAVSLPPLGNGRARPCGNEIELDLVPQRETGMTAYEIMLSESQERMLLVAQKGREQEVLRVFEKWGLDAVEVRTRHRRWQNARATARRSRRGNPNEASPTMLQFITSLERWEPPVPREMPEHVQAR